MNQYLRKQLYIFFLIASSAFLTAAAFLFPTYCCWMIYISMVPIFYGISQKYRFSFFQGFVWGLILYSFHCWALLLLLTHNIHCIAAIIGYILCVTYLSSTAGVLFYGYEKLSRYCYSYYSHAQLWAVMTIFYSLYMRYFSLFIFGRVEGYPFSFPLLPLAEYPLLLCPMRYINEYVFYFLILVFQLLLIRYKESLPILVIAIFIFVMGLFNQSDKTLPSYIEHIGYLRAPTNASNPWSAAQDISCSINDLKRKYPNISIILMPESTFKFPLNEHYHVIETISDNALNDTMHLIVGGHKSQEQKLFNCLYLINKRRIIQDYEKTHLMIFGEYQPWRFILDVIGIQFNNVQGKQFYKSTKGNNDARFNISSDFSFQGFICSEFYFEQYNIENENIPLIVIANDSWVARTPYFQHLLFLFVKFKAYQQRRSIFYIAHSGGWLITPTGAVYDLLTCR